MLTGSSLSQTPNSALVSGENGKSLALLRKGTAETADEKELLVTCHPAHGPHNAVALPVENFQSSACLVFPCRGM